MSKLQKILLATGMVLFVSAGLFPPVKTSESILNLKHTFLFQGAYGYIDLSNLLTRWLIILVSFASMIYLCKNQNKK